MPAPLPRSRTDSTAEAPPAGVEASAAMRNLLQGQEIMSACDRRRVLRPPMGLRRSDRREGLFRASLVSRSINNFAQTFQFCKDGFRRCSPHERLGMLVVARDESLDLALEICNRIK